jgi:type II secretory pathway pseudopilin PulG
MTLVELLVVVAILGLLAIAVLPNVANTAESRRSREAARMVSSFVAKAQSRSLGRAEPAGLMLMASGSTSFASLDVMLADVPPPYRGDTTDATITMAASGAAQRTGTASLNALASVVTAGVTTFDLIRFGGRGPFYELTAPPTGAGVSIRMLGTDADASDSELRGYTSLNTPWPAPEPLPFEIFRRPDPAGSPLTLSDGRAIDLFWSGFGPPNVGAVVGTYRRFQTSGSRVSLLFDGTGRLWQVVEASVAGTYRRAVTGPVFLLVGRADRATGDINADQSFNAGDDSTGANWQYADSWWIAIDPMTGVAKSAECVPNATDVIASQRWVREGLLGTGR